MNLGGLKRLASTIGAKVLDVAKDPGADLLTGMDQAYEHAYGTDHEVSIVGGKIDRTVVVVKEKKNSVQIKCWSCGRLVWVKKGFRCHAIGLCGSCIATFDQKSDTTLVKV